MNFLKQIFIWWQRETFGTKLVTLFLGKRVGVDDVGNRYYRHRVYEKKRWVIYKDMVEASKVPPEWHAWLHNMSRQPPAKNDPDSHPQWMKQHKPNYTGTSQAFARKSFVSTGLREYKPWRPHDGE